MLKQRIVTAIFALLVVLGAVMWGATPWKVLVFASCLLCVFEFSSVTGQRWYGFPAWVAYVLVAMVMWVPQWLTPIGLQTVIALTLLIPVVLRNTSTLPQTATLLVGALYIGFGGESLSALRGIGAGWTWLFLFMVSIWVTDTVAYFVGSWLKGPKLWPSISPKKTISGSLAGLIGAGVAASIVGGTLLDGKKVIAYFLLGLLISVLGQIGDLVESAYKRSAGIKDSGKLLPGHGGILDRVDSLLFAAPFAVYLITVAGVGWLV